MRKLFAKKESQNSDNTKPAPQLLDTFLRFWKKDAAVERLTDITVKHSVLELQSGGKIEQKDKDSCNMKGMVIRAVEFSSGGYKIGKTFAYKSTCPKKIIKFW